MRKWMGLMAGLLLAANVGVAAAATGAPPSAQQVHDLFKLMHMDQRMMQMGTQMSVFMQKALPCVPASYWNGFIDSTNAKELLDRMVPIYQQHFTAEDMDGLLKFYRSPLGQKVINEMPQTMAEGMKIGQEWGRARGMQMVAALQEQGKLDGNGRCPAMPAAGAGTPDLGKSAQ